MRVIIECDFTLWLNQAEATTTSGAKYIDSYKAALTTTGLSCGMVNSFLKNATNLLFDEGVSQVCENIEDYIKENKVSWMLACIIDHMRGGSNHLLEKHALTILEQLAILDEETLILKIQSGALSGIEYAKGVRDLLSMVNKNTNKEYETEYSVEVPHCLCESVDGYIYYVYEGRLLREKDKHIEITNNWSNVSESFKMVSWLLSLPTTKVNENGIELSHNGKFYIVTDEIRVVDESMKSYDVSEFRELSRINQLARPNRENEYFMEAVAQLCEHRNGIFEMDHIKRYSCNRGVFSLLESDGLIYISGNTVYEGEAKVITNNINENLGIDLRSRYKDMIKEELRDSELDKKVLEAIKKESDEKTQLRKRIQALTEKFKGDEVKLNILSQLAKKL